MLMSTMTIMSLFLFFVASSVVVWKTMMKLVMTFLRVFGPCVCCCYCSLVWLWCLWSWMSFFCFFVVFSLFSFNLFGEVNDFFRRTNIRAEKETQRCGRKGEQIGSQSNNEWKRLRVLSTLFHVTTTRE